MNYTLLFIRTERFIFLPTDMKEKVDLTSFLPRKNLIFGKYHKIWIHPLIQVLTNWVLHCSQIKKMGGYFSSNRNYGNTDFDIFAFTATDTRSNNLVSIDERFDKNNNRFVADNHQQTQPTTFESIPASKKANAIPLDMVQVKIDDLKMPINKKIGMNRIEYNVKEDFQLSTMAKLELDKLANFMTVQPQTIVELAYHTDTRGDERSNYALSRKRSLAAKAYLNSKGIPNTRIIAGAYGEKFPINYCKNGINCPEEMHAQNNRVDVFIVSGYQANPVLIAHEVPAADFNNQQFKYSLNVGPFDAVDNRTFFECKKINEAIKFQYTPKGKILVLGPYDTKEEAQAHKGLIERKGISKVMVNTISNTHFVHPLLQKKNSKDAAFDKNGFSVVIGPFRQVNNDLFHRYKQLDNRIKIQPYQGGTLIIMGPYSSETEAGRIKNMAQRKSDKKHKITLEKTSDITLDFLKKRNKKSFWQWLSSL